MVSMITAGSIRGHSEQWLPEGLGRGSAWGGEHECDGERDDYGRVGIGNSERWLPEGMQQAGEDAGVGRHGSVDSME